MADLCHFFDKAGVRLDETRAVRCPAVVAFRNRLVAEGYKRSSIDRKLSSLKSFFRLMVAARVIGQSPADSALVRGYRLEEQLTGKAILQRALRQILAAVTEVEDDLARTRDTALVFLLTYGGLRRSEAAMACWEDLRQEGPFYLLTLPQTKSGVPQDIKLQPVVVHHLNAYREALLRRGSPGTGRMLLGLPRRFYGRPLTDQSINLIVKRYALKAGVSQRVAAHMLRHTCCTLAIEGGAKQQQVQAHLRHKDLKTTMRYYENRERLTDNASDYIQLG